MSRWHRARFACLLMVLLGPATVRSQETLQQIRRDFEVPPNAARPRVWWHWMNGNITKEGIQLDLEWMHRVGIGGFQNFDAALGTPQVVEKRLAYMTPEWKEAFRYAISLARDLGLEVAIASSPGWSETGGPWIQPSQAMKKLVWSETDVEGGQRFTGTLPAPPSVTGPFQYIARPEFVSTLGEAPPPPGQYYGDVAVLGVRLPENDGFETKREPKVSSSGGQFDFASLRDGQHVETLPAAPVNEKAWIQFEFAESQIAHAVTLGLRNTDAPGATQIQELEASDNGRQFRTIATIPSSGAPECTISFSGVEAKFFRVTFRTTASPAEANPAGTTAGPANYEISKLVLHRSMRVNRFEEKAGFATAPDLYAYATPEADPGDIVPKSSVVDLTSEMRSNGTLDWTPSPGRWAILRFGYSLTGAWNSPASPEVTGLEVDKLNCTEGKRYLDQYLKLYEDTVGAPLGTHGIQYILTDSWEAGTQNWTNDFIAEFTTRRGYDPRPWMPVLTGRIVGSAKASDRFLWDFRKTISDLTAACHYNLVGAGARSRGMGRYGESHEGGRAFIGDGMEAKREAEVPMGALWADSPGSYGEHYTHDADLRESASVAHLYGQNLVAAESLTSSGPPWAYSPETLKPYADEEMAMGVNRFVYHTSVHQPLPDKAPGLTLGPFGQWFNRNETWAEAAEPWITYLARNSYMLQLGHFVADVAYFYGEDSNITALFADRAPEIPSGYNFDFVNSDALLNLLSVQGDRLVSPSGMSYRVLVMDPRCTTISLPVLKRLRELVRDGAVVVGPKPVESPSLSDDQAEFQLIAEQLWGGKTHAHPFGKGRVYSGERLADVLSDLRVPEDFEFSSQDGKPQLWFVHRALPGLDIYWVDNREDRREDVEGQFRVGGRAAEIWHADTGKVEPAAYRSEGGGMAVPLTLEPYESLFVVFSGRARGERQPLPSLRERTVVTLKGPWEVTFPPDRGAPATATFDPLMSWSSSPDEGIRYFSGTAVYHKSFEAGNWLASNGSLWLDLGEVKNIAEVSLNGKPLGIVWKRPFRVDITGLLKPGTNTLEVKVTNLWVNRLIGDQQPNVTKKYTFTTQKFYSSDSPLLPSGLLGPVAILKLETKASEGEGRSDK